MAAYDASQPAMGQAVRNGAVLGALAWTVYAVAETVFASLVPWMVKPGYAYSPVHRGFTLLLFAVYPLIGAVAGAGCGAALRALSGVLRHDAPVAGTLSLIIGFDLNLLHIILISPYSFESSVMHLVVPVVLSLVPLAAVIASRANRATAERLRFLTNPWTVSLYLTGIPWTTLQLLSDETTTLKIAGGVGYAVLVLLLGFALYRVVRGWKTAAVLPLAVTVTVAGAMVVDHTPLVVGDPPPVPDNADEHPNVILIILDTTRANRLSLYGYERPTTPNLEDFAKGATVYTRAVSSGDMTLTTHGTLFTGLYGRQHGAHRSERTPAGRPLADRFVTVAEMLLAQNYWTAAVVGNRGYVTPHFGFDQGFLFFDSRGPVPMFGHVPAYYVRRLVRAAFVPLAPRSSFDRVTRHAAAINDEAFRVLDRAKERGGPFFLFLNYMDAHNPYIPPAPYDTMFPGKDESFTSVHYGELLWAVMKRGKRKITPAEAEHLSSQYDGEIAYLDSELARLFGHIRSLGLYDDSLILITADHGEALGERSLVNHGVSVYQDQVYVPMIVKRPGQTEAEVVDRWVGSVDVAPTILDVAGVPVPDYMPGVSLARPDAVPERQVIAESYPHGPRSSFNRMERALVLGDHKLIRNDKGKKELYHLGHDADEEHDLLGSTDADFVATLEDRLDTWIRDTPESGESDDTEMDPEMRERLRALGYLD